MLPPPPPKPPYAIHGDVDITVLLSCVEIVCTNMMIIKTELSMDYDHRILREDFVDENRYDNINSILELVFVPFNALILYVKCSESFTHQVAIYIFQVWNAHRVFDEMSKMTVVGLNSLNGGFITVDVLDEKELLASEFVSRYCVVGVIQFIYAVYDQLRWITCYSYGYCVLISKKRSFIPCLKLVLSQSVLNSNFSCHDHYSRLLYALNNQEDLCDDYDLANAYSLGNIKGAPIFKYLNGVEVMFFHESKRVEWYGGCVKNHWQICSYGGLSKHFTRIRLPNIASIEKCIQVCLLCIQQHLDLMTNGMAIPTLIALPPSFTFFNFGAHTDLNCRARFCCGGISRQAALIITRFIPRCITYPTYNIVQEVTKYCWNREAHNFLFCLALKYGYMINVTETIVGYCYSVVLFNILIGKHIRAKWFMQNFPDHLVVVTSDRARNCSFRTPMVLTAILLLACSTGMFSHREIEQAMNGFKERQKLGHDSNDGRTSVYFIWGAYHGACILHFYIDNAQFRLPCYDVRVYFSSPLSKLQGCFSWKMVDYTFLKIEVLAISSQEKHFVEFGGDALVELHIYLYQRHDAYSFYYCMKIEAILQTSSIMQGRWQILQLSTHWESLGKSKTIWKDATVTQQYFSTFNKLMVIVHISIIEGYFLLVLTIANAFICESTIFQAVEFKLWDPGGCFIVHVEIATIILHYYLDFNLEDKVGFKGDDIVMSQNKGKGLETAESANEDWRVAQETKEGHFIKLEANYQGRRKSSINCKANITLRDFIPHG
jgi:hypothetical protein